MGLKPTRRMAGKLHRRVAWKEHTRIQREPAWLTPRNQRCKILLAATAAANSGERNLAAPQTKRAELIAAQ
eukprot:452093-Lingulodinium_polyedra.AAC.1